ncbi:MAG: geranylgeranylglyceryl/heptaprenylglyceryl phosphate synthase [Candidatus Micrarchaeota archaeon]
MVKKGKVEKYYEEKMRTQGALLFSLIDPDKFNLEKGAKVAKDSYEQGADVILVGGSIGAQGGLLDQTVKMIKEECGGLPVVLYPGSPAGLSEYADAVYFMHMLNSRDIYWLSTAQIQAAPVVQRMKIEAIPTTYLIIEPGRTVGWIGNANLVPRERSDLAAACALAAKYTGSHVFITDSGSGAPEPAPLPMISAISKACGDDLWYFCAGGVKEASQAAEIIDAGAAGIHVGNAFEDAGASHKIKRMAEAIHKAGKKRV